MKHLLGHFSAAKSVLSPPEQQYEGIFWAGVTGTYQEIRGDNGWMKVLGAANAQSGGCTEMGKGGEGPEGEKEGGGASRRPEESGLVNNATVLT